MYNLEISGGHEEIIDVAVIGAGAAGLSAALFLTRACRRTVIYDGGPTRISTIGKIHEFLGHEGITPAEFQARGRSEVDSYGGEFRSEAVLKIEPRSDGLFDVLGSQTQITARAIVLATGLVDVLPPVSGLREGLGRDVHLCPCFSGYEVRDKAFVAFGLPERLAQFGKFLTAWSSSVTVVTPYEFDPETRKRLRAFGVITVQDEVASLKREADQLVSVLTASGMELPCEAAFVAAPFKAASDLAASLCEVDEAGFAITDANGSTSRPGVWAIGNATDKLSHLAHSVAAGANVGPWIVDYLLESSLSSK
ncbi:NAD(P)/FAD-dependent oxidoreductase [Paenibacillus tuaregi]|uniref:NAD(P)/FAD-dependent oxidoreductase n=1 Tax=Paenibacillus tuaregi TaxID=1816681 RepID=UPI0008392B58|nr:NAD(P)/FAD-dependent oxidoreductase [Paenibacillus tuaregi]